MTFSYSAFIFTGLHILSTFYKVPHDGPQLSCIFEVGKSESETFYVHNSLFMREYLFEFHNASLFENVEIIYAGSECIHFACIQVYVSP